VTRRTFNHEQRGARSLLAASQGGEKESEGYLHTDRGIKISIYTLAGYRNSRLTISDQDPYLMF
jgi:hypothetical protein